MRAAVLVVCGVLPAGCLYLNPAYDPGGEGSSGAAASATTTGATTTGATTTAGTTAVDVSTGAPASTGATTAAPDLGTPRYPYFPVTSCVELQDHLDELGETPVSGLYSLDVAGAPGQLVDVYCDMDIAGGGWTLVGRSAGDQQLTSFGWSSARGDVADDGQAYSLDLVAHPIAFTAILLGDYATGKQWGGYAYQFEVGSGYVATYADSLLALGPPQTILGGCTPWATWMFQHGGHTSVDQAFFFRDLDVMDEGFFGLRADGFNLYTYTGCDMTGELNQKHGLLMVR